MLSKCWAGRVRSIDWDMLVIAPLENEAGPWPGMIVQSQIIIRANESVDIDVDRFEGKGDQLSESIDVL